jgi:signal transduction histidine kinase
MLNTRHTFVQPTLQEDEKNPVLESVLEIIDEAIFILNKSDFSIVDCNTAALKLFEAASKSQLINLPSFRLYNFEPFEFSIDKVYQELDINGEYSQEMSFRTFKQNIFWGKMVQKNLGFSNLDYTILKITKSANYLKDEQWLSEIIKLTTRSTGRQFFKEITKHLTQTFDAQYAFIARRVADDERRLKIFYLHGEGITSKYINARNSFVENIMRGYVSFYPTGIKELFTNDSFLAETNANSFIGSPFYDATGQVMGLIGVISSSEMEEIPNARYMLNILGSRVGAELQRIRSKEILRQQARELAEINQMKDKLLAVISNDLQAPLNTILGFSGMLRNKISDYNPAEMESKMKVMDNSIRNLYILLESLSDWSRLEQEKIKVELKTNNLRNILEDIKPNTKFLAEIKQIGLINKVPSALNIKADNYLSRSAIKSVTAYLLKNTMKSGNVTFDAQLVNGKWYFIVRSDKHSVDEQSVNFALKSTQQEFYTSSKDTSIPVLGIYIAREFMRLQKGKLSANYSENSVEFLFEFER